MIPQMNADERGWGSRGWLFVMLFVCLGISACRKLEAYSAYDNTQERAAFYERYNAEVLEKLETQKKELEAALAGELPEAERKEKKQQLEDTLRHLQRPKYFELLTEADLPRDLPWATGDNEPEIGSPEAKKGGTFHSYIQGGAYPPTIRSCGKDANNSFRNCHWDDIELGLTGMHPNTRNLIPSLADRWAVAEDGQSVYFHIDPDARWSDGRKVKSGDWLMSFYVYLSPYLTEPFYRIYYGEEYWGIATYGDDYLCIRLAAPKPLAPLFAGVPPFQEEFYKEFGPDFESRYNWRPRPTTGAYVILEKDIQKGRSIAMTRVKDWWAKDKKYNRYRFNADRIEYIQVRDDEKTFQLFLRGEIDTYLLVDPKMWYEKTEVPEVFNGYIEKATFYHQFPAISYGFYLNMSRPLLSNQDIRIGLQHASNWEKMIDLDLRGDAERLNLLASGYGEFSNPNVRTRPYSIPLAREAFARAGFTKSGDDGILQDDQGRRLSFTITFSKSPPVLETWLLRIKEEAKKAGVEFKLEGMDSTAAFQKISRKEHEIGFMGFQPSPPVPDYYQHFHSKEAYEPGTMKPRPMTNNLCVFADPEVDKILEANRSARSTEEIRETSWKLEEIFHERAVWVPAYRRPFYRVGYWRWVRWPDDFNVALGNEPDTNYVYWIDTDRRRETEEARHSGKTFPERNLVFDQFRETPAAK